MEIDQNIVGRLIDWEMGELPVSEVNALFQELIDNDLVDHVGDNLNANVPGFVTVLVHCGAIRPRHVC